MTSTNRVVANALVSLEELLKKQGLSRAEFDKMMKEMKDKGASAVHYMRGKDGRLLFKADGTTIGNAISEKAVNGEEVENTRTLPVSKQAWTECELKGIEAMKKYLASHKGVLPRTIKEVDDVLGIIPDIDVAEKQNVMSYFKYGKGKKFVTSNASKLTPVTTYKGCKIEKAEGERDSRLPAYYGSVAQPTYIVTDVDGVSQGGFETVEKAKRWCDQHPSRCANSRATDAKFKVGDKVNVDWFSGDQDYATVVKYNPSNDTYDVRLESGEIAHPKAKLLISANFRAINSKWVIMYRDGGKEKIEASSHDAAKKIAEAKSKKSGRGYTSVIVDDGVDYDRWQFFNAKACNSTNAVVQNALNATRKKAANSALPIGDIGVSDSTILWRMIDGGRDEPYHDEYQKRLDKMNQRDIPEDTISILKKYGYKFKNSSAKASRGTALNAAWSAERVEPGNEKELLSFHAEAFAKNPTQDRFERLARIIEGEASKGLLAKYYAPGNATSELMAAIREGREQIIGGKGSEVAKKIAGIVEGLRRIGTNSTNPVVANAMRETLNWSAFGGSDGQVVTMPIPKSEYGKSDLDFLVEWARKNSADLAKYYTPSNVASKVIALAEKAKRKIDDTTKRRQSEADARFGTGIGRVNVPDVPLKKTEPEIAEIRSVLAGIKQIPSASKEAQKRDAAMERRQKAETQRYYDTHQGARD